MFFFKYNLINFKVPLNTFQMKLYITCYVIRIRFSWDKKIQQCITPLLIILPTVMIKFLKTMFMQCSKTRHRFESSHIPLTDEFSESSQAEFCAVRKKQMVSLGIRFHNVIISQKNYFCFNAFYCTFYCRKFQAVAV